MTTDPTGPSDAAAFSGSTGAPSRRRIGLVLGGAMLLIVAGGATSLAATSTPSSAAGGSSSLTLGADPGLGDPGDAAFGRFGRHGFGAITIAAISGNDVTLETDDGWRRTITISGSVELTKGGQDIEVSDLEVGDQVRYRQVRNDDDSYTVTAVAVVIPTIQGRASAITSSGFTVTTRDGSVWTIAVDGSTTYEYGQGTGSLSDVTDGRAVRVSGTVTADNRMSALSVRVAGDRVVGQVTAKTADSITIERRDGSDLTIHVDAETTYRVAGVESADLGDVTIGMAIGVTGRARADGSIDADGVAAGNLRGLGRGRFQAPKGFDVPGLQMPDPGDPAIEEGLFGPTA